MMGGLYDVMVETTHALSLRHATNQTPYHKDNACVVSPANQTANEKIPQ